jgi:hypothetical protein
MLGGPEGADATFMPPSMTYCVVPAATDATVVAELRQRFAADPMISVIVDSREGKTVSPEVRQQRRPVLRWELSDGSASGVQFEQRMPPVDMSLAELSDAVIIARAITNDTAASTELRWRCYARMLTLLADRVGNRQAAHEMVPRMMDAMQRALPTYPPGTDFSRWLAGFVAATSLDF